MRTDQRVAVLIDCDNANPLVLEYAMQRANSSGRVVLKRAYGNHATFANRWKEPLIQKGFAPCLQFQYATGKNTSDIALALDALEALLDTRADFFVVVTSDSDFVYLCHKLRERGAAVHVVGEAKTPEALRGACDKFHEFVPVEPGRTTPGEARKLPAPVPTIPAGTSTVVTKIPRFVIDAVTQLAADAADGKVHLGALGNYLSQVQPGFTSKDFGYRKLIDMLRACPALELRDLGDQAWIVSPARKAA